MTSSNWDDKELAKTLDRSNKAAYVISHIKEPLEEIINTFRTKKGMFPSESINILLLLIFTYIDLLGYLYKSNTSSFNAVEFIREYLGRVDPRYKEIGGLLYDAFRHGLVHLATPKRIQLKNGIILDFLFTLVGQRENNFKVSKTHEIQKTGGRVDIHRLSLNLSLLYEDLLSAIDLYTDDVRHNQALSDIFWRAFETRRKPEKAKEAALLSKPYIQESDFNFVRKQISSLSQ